MQKKLSLTRKSAGRLGVWLIFVGLAVGGVFAQDRGVRVPVKDEQGNIVEKQLYDSSYALVIGAIDYQKTGWVKLDGVRDDVQAITGTLTAQGFTVEKLLNPTSLNLNSTIRAFVTKYGVKANNRLLIYYSGHGYTETDDNGIRRGYIVPVDAPSPEKQPEDFFARATTMDDIEGFARNIRSKHALFIFDSCFSGTLISRETLAPSKYISYITEKPVRQFITAGAANQVVPDESTFRRMFVKALDPNDDDNADKNKDGYVTGTELALYLQEKVIYYRGQSQTPQYGKLRDARFDQGDFVFALNKNSFAVAEPTNELSNKSRATSLANQALNEIMRGNSKEGEKLANDALQIDDNSALAYGMRGWAKHILIRDDYASSRSDLEKAVRLDSDNVLLRALLAVAYQNLNEKELARKSATEAVQRLIAPKTAIDYYARGISYNILKKTEDSILDFSNAIKFNPQFALAYLSRGSSYAVREHYVAKIQDFNKAIELNPEFVEAYFKRGILYAYKKDYEPVIRDCTKVIELDPKFAVAYYFRAIAFGKTGESAKAEADRQKYKQLGGK